MNYLRSVKYISISALAVFMSGCVSTMPILGGGSGSSVSGGAAGATSANKNESLESCDKTLGTVSIFEDQSLPWWNYYYRHYRSLGSTVPVIRTMVQQSNCFVIVERGAAMKAMQRERQLMNSGELRDNSNFGKGQIAAADYTLSPSVNFKESSMGSISGAARRLLPGSLFGGGSVGAKNNQAETTLLLIDNRSSVQVSSSIGSAQNYDFSFRGYSWGGNGWGGASGYAKSAEGKVIIAAFVDSYNQMVKALRNYKPQRVKGGLGTGGALEVDGQKKAKPQPKPQSRRQTSTQTVAVSSGGNVNVRGNRSVNVQVDAYDEQALNDYYRALKKAVEHLSKYSSMTPQQVNAISQQSGMGIDLWTLLWSPSFAGDFETSKIELESWPLAARQEGWNILGKKIKKYNKLFYKHRKTLLASDELRKDVRQRLNDIELVTEKSLFAEN